MNNIYALQARLIENLLERVEGNSSKEKDQRVLAAFEALKVAYGCRSKGNNGLPNITFDRPEERLAYVFMYMLSHINSTRHFLHRGCRLHGAPEFMSALRGHAPLNVVVVGAGPGSELLGLIMYLKEVGATGCAIQATLVDVCAGWWDMQCAVARAIRGAGWSITAEFALHNVLLPPSPSMLQKLKSAHLLTLVKVHEGSSEASVLGRWWFVDFGVGTPDSGF